jgi:quercetin dioxygenase-like cupin family protein
VEIIMLVRRNFLNVIVAAITLPAMTRIRNAQALQGGPQLTQLLKADLEGQGQTVQETVVNLLEMAAGISSPLHMHPGAQEIVFVIDGNLVVEIEGNGSREVAAGAIALIPAEAPHLVRNDTQTGARALVTHSRSNKEKPLAVVLKRPT